MDFGPLLKLLLCNDLSQTLYDRRNLVRTLGLCLLVFSRHLSKLYLPFGIHHDFTSLSILMLVWLPLSSYASVKFLYVFGWLGALVYVVSNAFRLEYLQAKTEVLLQLLIASVLSFALNFLIILGWYYHGWDWNCNGNRGNNGLYHNFYDSIFISFITECANGS